MSVTSAHTLTATPRSTKGIAREIDAGSRRGEFGSDGSSRGGRTTAAMLATARAAPTASRSQGRRSSPRNNVSAIRRKPLKVSASGFDTHCASGYRPHWCKQPGQWSGGHSLPPNTSPPTLSRCWRTWPSLRPGLLSTTHPPFTDTDRVSPGRCRVRDNVTWLSQRHRRTLTAPQRRGPRTVPG